MLHLKMILMPVFIARLVTLLLVPGEYDASTTSAGRKDPKRQVAVITKLRASASSAG